MSVSDPDRNPGAAWTAEAPAGEPALPGTEPPPGGESSESFPPGSWTPIAIVWGVLAVFAVSTLGAAVVVAFDPDLESAAATITFQAIFAGSLFVVPLVLASGRGRALAPLSALGLRAFRGRDLGRAALAYLVYIGFALVYAILVRPDQEDIARDLGYDEGTLAAVLTGVLIVGASPIAEETFFRGFAFAGLRRRLPLWAAAVISGILFGLPHYTGPDSVGVVPQLAVFGIVLAWLYERTGSLWPPIFLHMVNNALAFSILVS